MPIDRHGISKLFEGLPVTTWRDASLGADERVELLLAGMTLEEKVAQLGSRWPGGDVGDPAGGEETLNVAPMQDVFAAGAALSLADASRHGLGHLTRPYGSAP